MMTNSSHNTTRKILRKIVHKGRGAVVFSVDFHTIGSPAAVRQALSRLTKKGTINRVGVSLYYYPVINKNLGGKLPPPADAIARAIARRTSSKIVPTGALAANMLGLSTQVPAKRVYLTNGPSRNIVAGPYSINFKHVSPRRMAVKGKDCALVLEALRFIGPGNIDDAIVSKLKTALPSKTLAQLKKDARYAPAWMQPILNQITESRK
ncbi:MAG: DUF6088 family protein [Elusimicrobiales bacterium]